MEEHSDDTSGSSEFCLSGLTGLKTEIETLNSSTNVLKFYFSGIDTGSRNSAVKITCILKNAIAFVDSVRWQLRRQ